MTSWLYSSIKENRGFFLFVILMFIFRSAIADWNEVPTSSMKPTIIEGDRILVDKMAYDIRLPFTHISLLKLADPQKGDIIIFDSQVSELRLVKRVIGVPGDTIEMNDNVLSINGDQLDYQHISGTDRIEHLPNLKHKIRIKHATSQFASFGPTTVPDGHYLVLGDNRDNSADSRVIGFIPRNEIVGKTDKVVLSLNYDNYRIPRPDRFFQDI